MTRLVLGRRPADDREVFISGDDNPEAIRGLVLEHLERGTETLTTFSPVAADTFVRRLLAEEEEHKARLQVYNQVYISYGGGDHCVSSFKEPARLIHYNLGELYVDGELYPTRV